MAFVILARCPSSTFFFTELVAGVTTFVTSWVGVRWFGLPGLGISFLVTYVVYYAVVWLILRKEIALVWSPTNKWPLVAAVLAAGIVRFSPFAGLGQWRTPVALSFAFIAGIGSLTVIWKEIVGIETGTQAQRLIFGMLNKVKG